MHTPTYMNTWRKETWKLQVEFNMLESRESESQERRGWVVELAAGEE